VLPTRNIVNFFTNITLLTATYLSKARCSLFVLKVLLNPHSVNQAINDWLWWSEIFAIWRHYDANYSTTKISELVCQGHHQGYGLSSVTSSADGTIFIWDYLSGGIKTDEDMEWLVTRVTLLKVSTCMIHVNTRITTRVPTRGGMEGWVFILCCFACCFYCLFMYVFYLFNFK